ncbi:MAG: hypothetical protein LQ340_004344 [Diploschistes diacapsis]|nr:MAG: hypothetical protein LQ340_004344 [Diploschistes diacapsis]
MVCNASFDGGDVEDTTASTEESNYPKSTDPDYNIPIQEKTTTAYAQINSAQQTWNDLEAESGFASYEAYLDHYVQKWPQFGELLVILRGIRENEEEGILKHDSRLRVGSCCIFEVQEMGGLTALQSSNGPLNKEQATAVLECIRAPADGIVSRIVFINLPIHGGLSSYLINALGLGLRLDPRMFMAFMTRMTIERLDHDPRYNPRRNLRWRHHSRQSLTHLNCFTELRPLAPSFVAMDRLVMSYSDIRASGKCLPPVLLILGYDFPTQEHSSDLELGIIGTPAFSCETLEQPGHWPSLMASLIQKKLKENFTAKFDYRGFQLCSTLAFYYMQIAFLRSCCFRARSSFLRLDLSTEFDLRNPLNGMRVELYKHWYRLRRSTEDAQHGFGQLQQFAGGSRSELEDAHDPVQELRDAFASVLAECDRLESELKDHLQFQVGFFTLQESKRSIELSDRSIELTYVQMEEAKRGNMKVLCTISSDE